MPTRPTRDVGPGRSTRRDDRGHTTRTDQSPLRHGGSKLALDLSAPPWEAWRAAWPARVIRFIETYCIVPKGYGAGQPLELAAFQKEIIRRLWSEDNRAELDSIARGNGKSTFMAALGLAVIHLDRTGPHVPIVSTTKEKAEELLYLTVEMAEASPELYTRMYYFASKGELQTPRNSGRMFIQAANRASAQGFDPTLALVDEIGFVSKDLFTAMVGALGKRPFPGSRLLAMGTPGWDRGVMWDLRLRHQRGELADGFVYVEHAPDDEECDIGDRQAWAQANPLLREGKMDPQSLAVVAGILDEADFRTFRLGQWTAPVDAFMDLATWSVQPRIEVPEAGVRITLGFDGSSSGDSTALYGSLIDEPGVFRVGLWEKPEGADRRWRVDRNDVDGAVHRAFGRWDVELMRCDPFGWRSEIQQWQDEYGEDRVQVFLTSRKSIMAPASDRFLADALVEALPHDHDEALARHIGNAMAEKTVDGPIVRKDEREGGDARKIDALIAAIVAHEAAADRRQAPQGGVL